MRVTQAIFLSRMCRRADRMWYYPESVSSDTSSEGKKQRPKWRTWYLDIDTDPPVRCPLRAIDVQISQPHFLHALQHLPRLLIPRDPYLVPIAWILGRVEGVGETEVVVGEWRG